MIRTMLMPKEPTWWIWVGTAQLLSLGLAGVDHAFLIAIFLAVAQTVHFLMKHRSPSAFPAQIRVALTARARLGRGIHDGGDASAFPRSRFCQSSKFRFPSSLFSLLQCDPASRSSGLKSALLSDRRFD
jgi:hypothetical protein